MAMPGPIMKRKRTHPDHATSTTVVPCSAISKQAENWVVSKPYKSSRGPGGTYMWLRLKEPQVNTSTTSPSPAGGDVQCTAFTPWFELPPFLTQGVKVSTKFYGNGEKERQYSLMASLTEENNACLVRSLEQIRLSVGGSLAKKLRQVKRQNVMVTDTNKMLRNAIQFPWIKPFNLSVLPRIDDEEDDRIFEHLLFLPIGKSCKIWKHVTPTGGKGKTELMADYAHSVLKQHQLGGSLVLAHLSLRFAYLKPKKSLEINKRGGQILFPVTLHAEIEQIIVLPRQLGMVKSASLIAHLPHHMKPQPTEILPVLRLSKDAKMVLDSVGSEIAHGSNAADFTDGVLEWDESKDGTAASTKRTAFPSRKEPGGKKMRLVREAADAVEDMDDDDDDEDEDEEECFFPSGFPDEDDDSDNTTVEVRDSEEEEEEEEEEDSNEDDDEEDEEGETSETGSPEETVEAETEPSVDLDQEAVMTSGLAEKPVPNKVGKKQQEQQQQHHQSTMEEHMVPEPVQQNQQHYFREHPQEMRKFEQEVEISAAIASLTNDPGTSVGTQPRGNGPVAPVLLPPVASITGITKKSGGKGSKGGKQQVKRKTTTTATTRKKKSNKSELLMESAERYVVKQLQATNPRLLLPQTELSLKMNGISGLLQSLPIQEIIRGAGLENGITFDVAKRLLHSSMYKTQARILQLTTGQQLQ